MERAVRDRAARRVSSGCPLIGVRGVLGTLRDGKAHAVDSSGADVTDRVGSGITARGGPGAPEGRAPVSGQRPPGRGPGKGLNAPPD